MTKRLRYRWFLVLILVFISSIIIMASTGSPDATSQVKTEFPKSLSSYGDAHLNDIATILFNRIKEEPFNLIASIIFLCAIVHTFMSSKLLALAHRIENRYKAYRDKGGKSKDSTRFLIGYLHFLGEVEVVFGLWVIVLMGAIVLYFKDMQVAINYIAYNVNYTEPMFVVVIMTLASTRPILRFSRMIMSKVAHLYKGSLAAWWFSILTVGPILGSFITEPAAMTISALILADKFYELAPSNKLKYGTLALLFVNISVGGTLSHFAAPPVLMVAAKWDWGLYFMFTSFGFKAFIGIIISNIVYFIIFKKEFIGLQEQYSILSIQKELEKRFIKRSRLEEKFEQLEYQESTELDFANRFESKARSIKLALESRLRWHISDEDVDKELVIRSFDKMFDEVKEDELKKTLPGLLPKEKRPFYASPNWDKRNDKVPAWIILVHIIFLVWTVVNAHHPVLFVGGFLFFLGFADVTSAYQNNLDLRPSLLVGFFLAGLVIHGGLQGWWIAPVLGNLQELPLMIGAIILTAFNDNAAVTYLSTLVPNFSDALKYAVVAGAVTGGGLTVIANAPNPAGQSILKKYFDDGISPIGLLLYALIPTIIMGLCFILIP